MTESKGVNKRARCLPSDIRQKAILPKKKLPIVSIGLGGIVHDAHYPAYQLAGFEVVGAYDKDRERAETMQAKFAIPILYSSMEEMVECAPSDAVFDVAVPGQVIESILKQLPDNRAVLIQKPMGEDLASSRAIRDICREKMRYVPHVIAARDMVERGLLGEVCDFEVRMQINTPWELWAWLKPKPRMEILYHSIHYIDLCRSFFGTPSGVYAKTLTHPSSSAEIGGGVRTTVIMDYGSNPRVNVMTNHNHSYGQEMEQSYFKIEGTKGAIYVQVGLNMDYPRGAGDYFKYFLHDEEEAEAEAEGEGEGEKRKAQKAKEVAKRKWKTLEVEGSWFPEAFIGTMASLMRKVTGEVEELPTSVEDAHFTMGCVEAAYISSKSGATPIPE